VRQLPSVKVCFLGGCPRSGRNQDPVGALPRSRRPPRRRALDCLHSRCLRVKAAEKGVETTTPLRWDFWVTEVETTGMSRLGLAMSSWKDRGDRYVKTMIRVAPHCRQYRRKKRHVERERRVRKAAAHTSQSESLSPIGKERLLFAQSKGESTD
jgi:hypothetical protein